MISRWFSPTPFAMQLALWTAMLSVLLQFFDDDYTLSMIVQPDILLMLVGITVSIVPRYQYLGLMFFVSGALYLFLCSWYVAANHTWLAIWTIVPAVFVRTWWKEDSYINYVRYTLGFVMIISGVQKILAGTYTDGSYIAWLSFNGSATERMFSFLCSESALLASCFPYQVLGTGIVIWQIAVGIFLLAGFRSLWILLAEVSYLMSAGIFADELNFQVLNIALLTIVFKVGMPWWLFCLCLIFLLVDMVTLDMVYFHLIQLW